MDQVNLLKSVLIFDFYNNLANKKKHSFKCKLPNRIQIIDKFDMLSTNSSYEEVKENKPNDIKYNNNKLFNRLLNIIYKRIDNSNCHQNLKNNIMLDLNMMKDDNIYNLAYDWCFFHYFVNL